jgi:hypothetical protein
MITNLLGNNNMITSSSPHKLRGYLAIWSVPDLWAADASLLVSTWRSVSDWSDALWNSRPVGSLVPLETCRNCPHRWLLCSRSVDARLFAWAKCTSHSAYSTTCLSYVHQPHCLLCYLSEVCEQPLCIDTCNSTCLSCVQKPFRQLWRQADSFLQLETTLVVPVSKSNGDFVRIKNTTTGT